jgi:PHP family Zn ribbon phosphoesterase
MYEFICKNCGRHYYSASPTGVDDRCPVCGGELERSGAEGAFHEKPHLARPACRDRPPAWLRP